MVGTYLSGRLRILFTVRRRLFNVNGVRTVPWFQNYRNGSLNITFLKSYRIEVCMVIDQSLQDTY